MTKSFSQFLTEKKNKGLEYEKRVKRHLRKAMSGRPSFLRRSKGGGSFSAHENDLVANLNGQDYPIEIKANQRAQMGGISISYSYTDKQFHIKARSDMDDETLELIRESVEPLQPDIDRVVEWFQQNDDVFRYNKDPGFPLRVSQESWTRAVDEGVIADLNETIEYNTRFVNRYYGTKKVYYMQIGESGLFYMAENPLDLDIPKLKGDVNLEFRPGKSGKKYNKTHDYEYSTVILRLQGRLSFRGKSPMTLDTQEGAETFINAIEENNNK